MNKKCYYEYHNSDWYLGNFRSPKSIIPNSLKRVRCF